MLKVEDQGAIRLLRLDRAPVNALNGELLAALRDAVRGAPGDGVRGLILTGQGERFTAGLDVRAIIGADAPALSAFLSTLFDCLRALATCPVPVVAAINGHSPGGGAVLALACDWRVMAAGTARIGLNEVSVGLSPGPLIHQLLVRTIGARQAGHLLSTGAMLLCEEALAVGLVDAVVPALQVDEAALQWLHGVLALPRQAYQATRALVRADLVQLLEAAAGAEGSVAMAATVRDWLSAEVRSSLEALLSRRTSAR
ncbi:MAG: enoyl-CoA hydratase/isomerase family protein [Pseudomonadota bacterium]|jgi:1,4-dihydroxy-2-naphthoyl-CoA synthase